MNLPPYQNQGIPTPDYLAARLLSVTQVGQSAQNSPPPPSGMQSGEASLWASESIRSQVPEYHWLSQNKSEVNQPRWNSEAFPLSVYWTLCGASLVDDEEHVSLLQKALSAWTDISNGLVHFQILATGSADEKPSESQILFEWADSVTPGREHEVGHAERQLTNGLITQATITLIRQPAIDGGLQGRTQQRQRLYTTLLHEIGHALGLNHSVNPQDVMYYRGWQHTALSPNDGRRLRLLYGK